MRAMLLSLVLSVCLLPRAVGQTGTAKPALKPCSLLTAELVANASADRAAIAGAKPTEVSLGASGSACQWGDVMLQIDPVPAARVGELGKSDPKSWESVSGVGDAAYFHNVKDVTAELFVRVGARTIGILMDVPAGSKAATIRPKFVELAKAIVPKLR